MGRAEAKGGKKRPKKSRSRRISLRLGVLASLLLALLGATGDWYVHHTSDWLHAQEVKLPTFLTQTLLWFGNPVADITDGLGWTGHDAVYEYDEEAPAGSVAFAGLPRRVGAPAPADIRILERGEFTIGWSDTLRHPVWCAYHVKKDARYPEGKRPSFLVDRNVPRAPHPGDYTNSGFDRGHLAPNHAIVTRYGEVSQRKTFLMTNISPQSPALNRKSWREIEHRIADLWTARYGEIWVVVGAIPSSHGRHLGQTDIDLPDAYYQIIFAQVGLDIRALAVLIPQNISWDAWPARYITTIDHIEELTGLDFNPELPSFIQDPIEAELPTRLWPVRTQDILKQILLRFN